MLLALFGTLFGAAQASAAPRGPVGTTGVIKTTPVPPNGRVSCYGYYGTFKVDTYVIVVDWATSRDECFGISTNRTIWHTFPGAGGWSEMPGHGHADSVIGVPPEDDATGTRGVYVHVISNNSTWLQWYHTSGGWTGDWIQT
jgi:hypothetical protein